MLGVKNIDLEYIDGRTKRTIFSDVSFDIQSGEFVSLLGPSGSGKSSLLYIVSLLKTPTAGEIYLDDTDDGTQLTFYLPIKVVDDKNISPSIINENNLVERYNIEFSDIY